VLAWGGLRGAISLALVLSLPAGFADREILCIMAFGVVLFTLLVQGTTMSVLLRRLGLVQRGEVELEYERRHGRLVAARAARDHIQQLHQAGLISATTWDELQPELEQQIQDYQEAQRALLREQPALRSEEIDDTRREALRAQRAMLTNLLNTGVISEHVYEELVTQVDGALVGELPPDEAAPAMNTTPGASASTRE
jgi:CPA1 family monovalent cation:H+ antiporter